MSSAPIAQPVSQPLPLVTLALALSLGAAVSLGITRFAYGLLLPPMRADLGWSYALAGGLNAANAAGYLIGALLTPALLRRMQPGRVLLAGSSIATVLTLLSGLFTDAGLWLAQRLAAGTASALVFMTGGLLAARLGAQDPARSGLLIGLYYGGTGLGIVLSALGVPLAMQAAGAAAHPWAWGWVALGLLCTLGTLALVWPARRLDRQVIAVATGAGSRALAAQGAPATVFAWRDCRFGLAGYAMFGIGYIGYMTFVIALLREQGQSPLRITMFYALLGVAVMGSSRLWAGLLDRHRDGRPLAVLNGLLGLATLMPAVVTAWPLVLASGLLFGAVFLSVVASTTAFVRHNLPPAQWASGIGAFTIVFAAGQIVGPALVGWLSDITGGLRPGFIVSAVVLWAGSLMALRQRSLGRP